MSIIVKTLTDQDLEIADAALRGRATVKSASYIKVSGYELIDHLTKLTLESDEEAYIVSCGGPFGQGGNQTSVNPSSEGFTGVRRATDVPLAREAEDAYSQFWRYLA